MASTSNQNVAQDGNDTSHPNDNLVRLPPKKKVKVATLDETFVKYLNDESYHDVHLRCTDGVRVGTRREVLAERNEIFRTMLLGGFREGNSDVIDVEYDSSVVKAIVEYLNTNKASILKVQEEKIESQVELLISLLRAGIFYDMPALCHDALDCIDQCLRKDPTFAVAILEECCGDLGGGLPADLKEIVLPHVWIGSLVEEDNKRELGKMNPAVVEEVLQDKNSGLSECDLFKLIQLWLSSVYITGTQEKDTAQDMATKFVQDYIRLERIPPDKLSSDVALSGLVTANQLMEAYKAQAFAATTSTIDFLFSRPQIIWKKSRSKDVLIPQGYKNTSYANDVLDIPPITTGRYQWTIELLDICFLFLGITIQEKSHEIAFPWNDESFYFGWNDTSWGLAENGEVYCDCEVIAECPYSLEDSDTKVTFRLDLFDEVRNGSLFVSVDGAAPFLMCGDLCSKIIGNGSSEKGYLPAISLYDDDMRNHVRIVEFRKLCFT